MATVLSTNKTTVRTIDNNTGEILNDYQELTIDENRTTRDDEPEYVKLYLDDIMLLKDLPRGMNPILYWLLRNCMPYFNQADGEFAVNMPMKRKMAKELGISISQVSNAFSRFTAAQILFRIDRGYYQFNPYLFGRGQWKDVKRVRLQIDYGDGGRKLEAIINEGEE